MKGWWQGLLLAGIGCLVLSGCKDIRQSLVVEHQPPKASPTPVVELSPTPTSTPTPTPTPIPSPTPTLAPLPVGNRDGAAGVVVVINNTGRRFRSIRVRGSDSEDWGKNLIPADASIHMEETFALYYPPSDGYYQIQIRDSEGREYYLYDHNLKDMDSAVLRLDGAGDPYMAYMSKSEQREKNTEGYSWVEESYERNEGSINNSSNDSSEADEFTVSLSQSYSSDENEGWTDSGLSDEYGWDS